VLPPVVGIKLEIIDQCCHKEYFIVPEWALLCTVARQSACDRIGKLARTTS